MPKPILQDHISLIAKHEQEFLTRRTSSERLGDLLGSYVGSLGFVAIHIFWFAGWLLINTLSFGIRHFDPFPFPFLNAIVAGEAIFLASFIVMRQGRASRRSDEREHLMLQILMLVEKEITAVLSIDRELAGRMGMKEIAKDAGIEQLSRQTSIDEMAQTLHEELDGR
jgi:uncharacterized membrane protein